jgi:hypothetical protein
MDLEGIIKQLVQERNQIDASILAIECIVASRNCGPWRHPKWMVMASAPSKRRSPIEGHGMIEARLRPGYIALVTAHTLAPNDEAWLPLMRDVLRLPAWMLPAIQRTVIRGHWRNADDPLRASGCALGSRRSEWV